MAKNSVIANNPALKAYLMLRAVQMLKEQKQPRKLSYWEITKNKFVDLYRSQEKLDLDWVFEFTRDFFGSFVASVRHYSIHSIVAILVSTGIIAGSAVLYNNIFKDLPTPQDLIEKQPNLSTRILDRNGEVLYKIYDDENRTWVKLEEIPISLVYATVAIEDQDFYYHHGFSIRGIVRAVIANFRNETIQGGSTLTQQLVKKRLLSPERTITRKIKELLLAVMVEESFTKDQILEMYLNQVPYGGSSYGVEEASQRYFGKSVRDLTLPESALLAGLPVAPSVYTPFGPTPELAKQRQEEVLRRMVEDGYITQEDADHAKATDLPIQPDTIPIEAPHFVMYVRHLLAQQYGEDMLNRGGLEVVTSLDIDLQRKAQQIVTSEVEKIKPLRVSNGAALITNPNTGEILTMVGSTNYFDTTHDGQVNVTLAPRQPGSSIKPLTYSLALENGLTASSIIDDSPITYLVEGSDPYSPVNYDGRFHGKVTIRESLASSYNIPAVKTLNTLGVTNLIDQAEKMGITTWGDRSRFGLSLTLGGGEVKMTEMATMYGAFANGGYNVPLNPILQVYDKDHKLLYENPCFSNQDSCLDNAVISPETAFIISNILADNRARTPAFGPLSVLNIPDREVAVKTGTTNSLRDNWTIGYTSDFVVAVWVGNNDNTPMSYVASGITGASPIWNKLTYLMMPDDYAHQFIQPAGVVKTAICAASNTLVCQGCPNIREEFYKDGTQPAYRCSAGYFSINPDESPDGTQFDHTWNFANIR